MHLKNRLQLLLPSVLSCLSVFLSQFALLLVPLYFPFLSLLFMLAISGALLLAGAVFGKFCRRLLGISGSAVAFVFFTVLFVWGVYISVIREGISPVKNVIINTEFALLVVGLYRIHHSDPGFVTTHRSSLDRADPNTHSAEGMLSESNGLPQKQCSKEIERVRYCQICNAYIKGFDHHCPAFGNCIGQSNYLLFLVLLIGFIIVEVSYVQCVSQFIVIRQNILAIGLEMNISNNLPVSTMLFSILQVPWQVVFLVWHIYCIFGNIKTDEWIFLSNMMEFTCDVIHRSSL
ncbi:uncharacterized protein [Aristolochia californica]|uniref:uncharacterized protein isoform X2 n=1 Tax=Aristolochia californica TaxID=171875 RepID=UPI0035DF5379